MSSTQPQLPPFLTLPAEIRLKIYALVLPQSLRLRFKPHRRNGNRTWRKKQNLHSLTASGHKRISLLLTSRLLHRESAPLFYAVNTFVLEIDGYSFTDTLRTHVLGYMRDVEIGPWNVGRYSVWYRNRLERVLGGAGRVFVDLRRLTVRVEEKNSFAHGLVHGMLGGLLREAGRRRLESVVLMGKEGFGRRCVAGLVGTTLGEGWVRIGKVCWVREKGGRGVDGVEEGLEGGLMDVQL